VDPCVTAHAPTAVALLRLLLQQPAAWILNRDINPSVVDPHAARSPNIVISESSWLQPVPWITNREPTAPALARSSAHGTQLLLVLLRTASAAPLEVGGPDNRAISIAGAGGRRRGTQSPVTVAGAVMLQPLKAADIHKPREPAVAGYDLARTARSLITLLLLLLALLRAMSDQR
jgi:hypothetical protein